MSLLDPIICRAPLDFKAGGPNRCACPVCRRLRPGTFPREVPGLGGDVINGPDKAPYEGNPLEDNDISVTSSPPCRLGG